MVTDAFWLPLPQVHPSTIEWSKEKAAVSMLVTLPAADLIGSDGSFEASKE